MKKLTDSELDAIAHSLGINLYHSKQSTQKKDSILPDEFYRNYYCYGKENDNLPDKFKNLLELGFIKIFKKFGNGLFFVTYEGMKYFRSYFKEYVTDKFKPLSKSKQKYQDYLHSEVCETFSEWLGVITPKIEYEYYGSKLRKYVSVKYPGVEGEFKLNNKEAKDSYKLALKKHKLSLSY